ncbi:hypothetical protein EAE96_003199 [Botrytis aclada]|nr:hypothetical protein EAE96_003199 [Botrytis aclada]
MIARHAGRKFDNVLEKRYQQRQIQRSRNPVSNPGQPRRERKIQPSSTCKRVVERWCTTARSTSPNLR